MAQAIVAQATVPVLNAPANVVASSRWRVVAARLRGAAERRSCRTPSCIARRGDHGATEARERRGFAFPVLLRSPGFHTGQHFRAGGGRRCVARCGPLAALPGAALLAIAFTSTSVTPPAISASIASSAPGRGRTLPAASSDRASSGKSTTSAPTCATASRPSGGRSGLFLAGGSGAAWGARGGRTRSDPRAARSRLRRDRFRDRRRGKRGAL